MGTPIIAQHDPSTRRRTRSAFAALAVTVLLSGCASDNQEAGSYEHGQFVPALPMPSADLDQSKAVSRIAFGSCFSSFRSGEIFGQIRADQPDAFVFLGDNVYADDESEDATLLSLREAYAALEAEPNFAGLRAEVPVLPTWDDHDYGLDDAGGDWPHQAMSESLFEHVWAFSSNEGLLDRPGVYYAKTMGPPGQQLQMILLDTRSFRSPLTRHPEQSVGRYTPSEDPNQDLLGQVQWDWLEQQLLAPADLRIIVTSIQVIADGHHWEAWRMMPKERQRLYQLFRDTAAGGVILVSGDRHAASMYQRADVLSYPLYEMTTSSLNIPLSTWVDDPQPEPEPHRLGGVYFETNYGLIDINWDEREVLLQVNDATGNPVQQRVIEIDMLKPRTSDD